MKASIDTIITEFAIRGLEAQDHDLFMRRVANALNGFPKESLFYGRITHVTLRGPEFIPDLFGAAKKSIWSKAKRDSAVMTDYTIGVGENGTAISVVFNYTWDDEGTSRKDGVELTVRQDSLYADAFDYTVD